MWGKDERQISLQNENQIAKLLKILTERLKVVKVA